MSPGASIVVRGHGDPALLDRTLASLVSSGQVRKEIILVGATADAAHRASRLFAHDEFAWLPCAGLEATAAVNEGLKRARHDLLTIASCGDGHFGDTLSAVASAALADPGAAAFYGDAMICDGGGKPVGEFDTNDSPETRRPGHCRFCPPSTFFRKTAAERAGWLDPSLAYWAEYDFWVRLDFSGQRFQHVRGLIASRARDAAKAAPSDFSSPPCRESLDEMMGVRVRADSGVLSTAHLAWYGEARGALARGGAAGARDALRFALEARDIWYRGQRLSDDAHAQLRRDLSERISHNSFAKEFAVPPAEPSSLVPFQMLRRRLFRLSHHSPRPVRLPRAYASETAPDPAPGIAVVTPSFNQGQFLESTILSVTGQNYPALQYVVQDGGSTDGSVEVLKKHAGNLLFWESAPDGGQAAAINRGFSRTSGEIMAYLNSDDLLLPGSLAYVATFFSRHPEVDVVYGHRVMIDGAGKEVGRWILPAHDNQAIALADFIPQETMFWRRRAWDKVGGALDESFRSAMDWDLILRFRAEGLRFYRAPRFLGAFRVWEDQKTRSWWLPVGRKESEKLIARSLGSLPKREELRGGLRGYIRRHWVLDKLYLAGLYRC